LALVGISSCPSRESSSVSFICINTLTSIASGKMKQRHINLMWWLSQLDWAIECPDTRSNIILDVYVQVFLDKSNIWIGRWSKADCSP
jgi:hypothetical protein